MRLPAKLILSIYLALSLVGCRNTSPPKLTADKDTIITLSRGPCYGTCPSYTVTIKGDGTVTLAGTKFSVSRDTSSPRQEVKGQGSISQDQLRDLVAEFEHINYFSLNGNYTTQGTDCPSYSTDASTATTSIKINGSSKSVSHYRGCSGTDTLRTLGDLENRIDKVAGTEQWLK
jgi:hypothetical protein